MSTSFLVEFRLQGHAKQYARWVNARVHREAKRLGMGELSEHKFVSHITLFGGATTNNLSKVTAMAERIGRKYSLVPFKLGGFDKFQNPDANWLYLDVDPSPDLEQLRNELSQELLRSERMIYDSCQPHDHRSKCEFHSAIGKYSPRDKVKFEKLLYYAETKCNLENFKQYKASVFGRIFSILKKYVLREEGNDARINLHLLRITILGKGSRIQSEYDLVLRKLLSRREALSRYWYKKSVDRLKELLNRPTAHKSPTSHGSIYFIGDTHFDHKNIIKYAHRPFSSVIEMNSTIKDNWNCTVGEGDSVYFLGDWAWGWGHKPPKYWMSQLKGTIFPIKGDHDREARGVRLENTRVLPVNGFTFLLIHNPEDRKTDWRGWMIHGHVHNNRMDKYPFINGEQKTVNVSAELINYKPVSLDFLLSLNLDSIKRMRTIDSQPERW